MNSNVDEVGTPEFTEACSAGSILGRTALYLRCYFKLDVSGLSLGIVMRRLLRLALFAVMCLLESLSFAADVVTLAGQQVAAFPIVTGESASDAVRTQAKTLASYFRRMTGATFEQTVGNGATGITVGVVSDFPILKLEKQLDAHDATRREEYVLQSHAEGLRIIGASELAVRHAVWDVLYRCGYRQFFPGPKWEVVPQHQKLTLAVDVLEKPSYHSRRIWYGFGAWDYAKEPYRDWCEKNRAVQGIELHTGHAYDGILSRNKQAFAEHPEYLGLVGGQRKSTKFCISNLGLRQLVVADALAQIAADPSKQSVSVDPSDGGGWCECESCAKLGSVTDRALTLANAVAEGLATKYGDQKFVGMYAYNQHSPPPSIKAHPRVVVSVATSFITGGYSIDELLAGWSAKASMLGIREYYSVNTWDRDLPGAARGGKIDYLKQTLPHFHAKSARFLSAESSDNWGPNGLGYYLASRMLWDVREAERLDALQADFFEKCFGTAEAPMRKFYALLDGSHRQPMSDDLVGRMYRLIEEARTATSDKATRARLDDLTLYTRYCELWLDYSTARDAARQAAFETLIRHGYRMRTTMLIHSLALYRDLDGRDKSVVIPAEAKWNVPEPKNSWKSSEPFNSGELDAIRRNGIAARQLLDFEPKSFSTDLVPATPLKLKSDKLGSMGLYSRQPRILYSWVAQAPQTYALTVTAGTVYTNRGVTKLDLYPAAEAEGRSIAHAEVPPTREPVAVELKSSLSGLQRLEVLAGGGARTDWPEDVPMTIESSFEHPGQFHGRWSLYFYVPRGTAVIGGFSEGEGTLRNPSGTVARKFDTKPGFFSVAVPTGDDGKLWKWEQCAGDKLLMTVPPYLARSASELLLPKEVVERDAR